MKDSKDRLFIIINIFIFITMLIAVPVTLTVGSRASRLDNLGIPHWQNIVTFTLLSNIFLGITALVTAIIKYRSSKHRQKSPAYFDAWYLIATTAGMVTFLTVILFLAPMRAVNGKDYFDMILEPMFFLHFLNPVLASISYMFLFKDHKATLKSRFMAILPIVFYAVPYVLCVAVFKIWPDFYGLTFGGKYYLMPLVFIAFSLMSFLIASVLSYFHNKKPSVENAQKV